MSNTIMDVRELTFTKRDFFEYDLETVQNVTPSLYRAFAA